MRKLIYTKKWFFAVVCIYQVIALISSLFTFLKAGISPGSILVVMLNLLISIAIFMKLSISKGIMQFFFTFAVIALMIQMFVAPSDLLRAIVLSALAVFYLFLMVSVTRYTRKESKEVQN
ncbi:MAG: hypothetical protein ACPF9D_12360 [Owenweeksia sp.]